MWGILILFGLILLGQFVCTKIDEWRLKRWQKRYELKHKKLTRAYHPSPDYKTKYANGYKVKDIPYRGKYNDIN